MTALLARFWPHLLALAMVTGGYFYVTNLREERDAAEAKVAELSAALETEKANEKVVTQYVDRKVEVVRRVPVIQRQLVRLCDEQPGLPRAGNPDAAAEAQAGDGRLDALGREIADCIAESAQLDALQAVIEPQRAEE